MSEEQCQAFVVQAVSHAMARDGSSGGNIRTVIINKDGIKRSFLDGTKVHCLPESTRQMLISNLFAQSVNCFHGLGLTTSRLYLV